MRIIHVVVLLVGWIGFIAMGFMLVRANLRDEQRKQMEEELRLEEEG